VDFDLTHYDLEYYTKKKKEYEEGKAWKITPFFMNLDVENKLVLDYGSAAGNMAFEAEKRKARRVIAYDPIYDDHPAIIELIQTGAVRFLTTREVSKINDKFDLILCSDVIEHVIPNEVVVFIKDLIRFSHDDSIICINSPVRINLAWLIGKPLASSQQGHINVMNPWKVVSLFKKFGFRLLEKPRIIAVSKNRWIRKLEDLPFPFNALWGGHYFLRFISEKHAG
jgi:SAM-dependent methyltransferase